MAEPQMEKKKQKTSASSSMSLGSSLLSDSVSESAKMAQLAEILLVPDWSLLPEALLELISKHVEKECCSFVDVIHARSVCTSWRSTFPFPSSILRQRYSLPESSEFPCDTKGKCIEKFPLFLFRVKTPPMSPSEYFLGGISRKDHHHTELRLPSPIQCSVKATLPGYDPILMNVSDSQILPLGHHYKLLGCVPEARAECYNGFAFLQEEKGDFVVLFNYSIYLLAYISSESRWIQFESTSNSPCKDLYTFRGKFYAVFTEGEISVIDPYSMKETPLMPQQDYQDSSKYLVPCGNEELFLIEKIIPSINDVACRVSKLDEEAGQWVVVNDLGDRVLFIGQLANVGCSVKEFPADCGLSMNSILFLDEPGSVTFSYKYGVETGNEEDDLSFWRFSRENRVMIHNRSPPVAALQVETVPDVGFLFFV